METYTVGGSAKMDLGKLTRVQRDVRAMIRGAMLTASVAELRGELALSLSAGDVFRATCVRELLAEEGE